MAPPDPAARRFRAHPGWHVLGGLLVLGWGGVMLGMFWPAREASAAVELDGRSLAGSLREEELWWGAYQQGRKLGHVRARTERTESGFRLEQTTELRVSVAGLVQPVRSDVRVRLDHDLQLQGFDFELRAGPLGLEVSGRMEPGALELEVALAGERSRRRLELAEPPLFDLALPALLARQDLRPGARFRVRVFDPRSLANRSELVEVVGPEAVDVGGRLEPGVHLRRSAAGLQLDTWLDPDGRVLKEQIEGGLNLLRQEREQAIELPSEAAEVPAAEELLDGLLPAAGVERSGGRR